MENPSLENIVKVRYCEMDQDLMVKPSALMHFLEDIASENAENLGFGYTFVRENNLAWCLLKYHMEFSSYPKGIYDLTVQTKPRGYNKIFAFRDFELLDNEKSLAKVISTWSLINMDTRNIVPASSVFIDNPHMPPYQKSIDEMNYEKIKPLERVDKEKVFEIRYDDIDVNKHANNSNYIVWAFETLNYDFRSSKKLKSLDLVYKKEVKFGDSIISQVEINPNKTNHVLKSNATGEDLCLILANWCDR